MNLDYKQIASSEGIGAYGSIGIKILIAHQRDLTEDEITDIQMAAMKITGSIMYKTIELDPRTIAANKEDKAKIIALFPDAIFVEEIPNGYSSGISSPWFIITTRIGRIKIGWRKRVINIDWTESLVKEQGDELFPEINNTKGTKYDKEHYIHAWGYEEAKIVIDRLFTAEEWMRDAKLREEAGGEPI